MKKSTLKIRDRCTLYSVRDKQRRYIDSADLSIKPFLRLCQSRGHFAALAADERPVIRWQVDSSQGQYDRDHYPKTDGRDFATCAWGETTFRGPS